MKRIFVYSAKTLTACLFLLTFLNPSFAKTSCVIPYLAKDVTKGTLPPMSQRLPTTPKVINPLTLGRKVGSYGGTLHMAMAKLKDNKRMVVYGYARLVGYDEALNLYPDILLSYNVIEGRKFIFHLRPNHRWSDGVLFTTEDFRYWWEDIANNKALYPSGPPVSLRIKGFFPKVSFPDKETIIYEWPIPNPSFLSLLAGASPLYIYAPAHYLKQFHKRYQTPKKLAQLLKKYHQKKWGRLHNNLSKAYKNLNPDLPTLEPWVLTTSITSKRSIFVRNPYFYRVDARGCQLPYIDRWIFARTNAKLIPARAATGELDLQANYLSFNQLPLFIQNQKTYNFKTYLWRNGTGSDLALYPNLNYNDPVWREVLRSKRFRQALSLAIDRPTINRIIYLDLALPMQNTVLHKSPLYRPFYQRAFTRFNLKQANKRLDSMGLKWGENGLRQLPDGRPLEIILETDSLNDVQTDVLALIKHTWKKAGIGLFIKPTSEAVLRRRAFSGRTMMTISRGVNNALISPQSSPKEFVPTQQIKYQWPKWGQYYETMGRSGQAPDMPIAQDLMNAYDNWFGAQTKKEKTAAWQQILAINATQLFTIGLISQTLQPVVVSNHLHNVPQEGYWSFTPTAQFGVYHPDLFFFDNIKPSKQPLAPPNKNGQQQLQQRGDQ